MDTINAMNGAEPLVSCLCVSSNRPHFLRKAILCFDSQTYQNKEMIVVSAHYDSEYEEIITNAISAGIRVKYHPVDSPSKITLGDLRNISVQRASGEIICVWDDDDWHHPLRIALQVADMLNNCKDGSVLAYCVLYNSITEEASLSFPFFHPATILCKKNALEDDMPYPKLNLEEDLGFFRKLNEKNIFKPLINPTLYIYVFHGKNSWNQEHFDKIFRQSQVINAPYNEIVKAAVLGTKSVAETSKLLSEPALLSSLNYLGWY